jgi:hypothetical protein
MVYMTNLASLGKVSSNLFDHDLGMKSAYFVDLPACVSLTICGLLGMRASCSSGVGWTQDPPLTDNIHLIVSASCIYANIGRHKVAGISFL